MLRGIEYADSVGEKLYINIALRSIWTLGCAIKTWHEYVTGMASFEHYYDPSTGAGLNLSCYGHLEGLVEGAGVLAGILLGPAGFWFICLALRS